TDRPVIFAFHGYPWLIHRLTYRRTNHTNLHVRGYKEEGTVTTPFDMVMRNDLDRFHLVMDVIDRVPSLGSHAAELRQSMVDRRLTEPVVIDDSVMSEIAAVGALAPLHNDAALLAVAAARRLIPDRPHVACFDTAFHADLPDAVRRYPVPATWAATFGIRRFG